MNKPGIYTYVAAAGADNIVTAKPAILHRVIIGKDVATSTIEISDHVSDGNGNTKIKLTGSTLMTAVGGALQVGAIFNSGITADLTNQTDVTFVWSPLV